MHLEYVVNPDALAVEELMEFVQLYFPADDTKVDRNGNVVFNFSGFGNYCSNSFKYIMEYGLAFRSDYPLPSKEGVVRPRYDCQRPKGLKVFIDGYKTLLVHEIAAQLPNSPIASPSRFTKVFTTGIIRLIQYTWVLLRQKLPLPPPPPLVPNLPTPPHLGMPS